MTITGSNVGCGWCLGKPDLPSHADCRQESDSANLRVSSNRDGCGERHSAEQNRATPKAC